MSIAVCLIALALGYSVYASALKEKKELKLLGQIIGVSVMVLSLVGTLCGVAHKAQVCGKMSYGPMKGMCPMMSKDNCPIGPGHSMPNGK